MHLKTEKANNYPDIVLYELNGLNRYDYVEYIAEQEKLTLKDDESISETELKRIFFKMELNLNSFLIALSLSNAAENVGRDIVDIQNEVQKSFGLDGLRSMSQQVFALSGMIRESTGDIKQEVNEAGTTSEAEEQTAEKP